MSLLVATRRAMLRPAPGGEAAAANWWELEGRTAIAAYQPKGAASLLASLVDLTGNGNDASGSSLSWNTDEGWTDGAAVTPGFLTDTGVWTVAIHYLNPNAGNPPASHTVLNGGGLRIWQRDIVNRHYAYHNPAHPAQFITGFPYVGGVAIIAYDKYYTDGTLQMTLNDVASLTNGASVSLNASASLPVTIQSVAFWNAQLDADEVADLTVAMAAL